MAKKKTANSEKEITLKLKLTPAEHKNLRIAAAETEMTLADFIRESVLTSAAAAVEEYYQRELVPKKAKRSQRVD